MGDRHPALLRFLPLALLATAQMAQASSVLFSQASYIGLEAQAQVRVLDADLNTDSGTAQSVVVLVVSNSDITGIELTLTEDGLDSDTFISGPLSFSFQSSSSDEDRILVAHGDMVAAIYTDFSPFEQVVGTAIWYFFQPGDPSPTRTRTPVPPTPAPTETPTRTATSTPTELPLFTPVPRPTPKLPRLLLVDDDGSPVFPNTRPFYEQALDDASLPFDVALGPSLTKAQTDAYDVLVWFNGEAFVDTLILREQEVLEYFLGEKKGKLVFSSQDYLYEETGNLDGPIRSSSFAARFLAVQSVMNDVVGPTTLFGVAGAQTDGIEIVLDPEGPVIIDADKITHGAQDYLEDADENSVALLRPLENNYGVAFFAFPLEAVVPGPGNNNMSAILRRTICAGLFDCGDPKAAGRIFFNKEVYYTERDQAVITLFDANLNTNPETKQFASVGVGSTFGGVGFILEETGPNTGIFDTATAGKNLRFSKTVNDGDRGILKVFDGDSFAVGYGDISPPGGSSQRVYWFESLPSTPTSTRTPTPPGGGPGPAPRDVPAMPAAIAGLLLVLMTAASALTGRQRRLPRE